MTKKVIIIFAVAFILFQGAAHAFDTQGDIVFRDALYGAGIGALLGTAFYLVDDDDFGEKIAVGVIIGTVGGLLYGLHETSSLVQIEKDEIKFAVPTPVIQKKNNDVQYSASLLKTKF